MKTIYEELEHIATTNNGLLKAEDVVDYARNPSTALHGSFEWDDSEAAHQYRLDQARKIIRVSVTLIAGTNEQHNVFVSLKEDRQNDGGGYRFLVDVLNDDDMRERLFDQAKSDFLLWKRKYERLKELAPVFDAMEKIVH